MREGTPAVDEAALLELTRRSCGQGERLSPRGRSSLARVFRLVALPVRERGWGERNDEGMAFLLRAFAESW